MRKLILYAFLLFAFNSTFAQLGGNSIYSFLNTPHNAHVGAVGINVSDGRDNPSMVVYNPSLLNDEMKNQLQFNESFYAPGIKYSSASYVLKNKNEKLRSFGVNNLSYESMDRRDASGYKSGEFFGNETVLYYNVANQINNFTLGVNLKYAQSLLERYFSAAILTDLGITFVHPEKDMTFGLVMKNAGIQLFKYSVVKENLPFQVNMGITFKPEHMPIRISVTAHDLQRFNIVYQDPNDASNYLFFDSSAVLNKVSLLEKLVTHINFSGELYFSKNTHFKCGYHFQRRNELVIERLSLGKSGGAGFSWGFSTKIRGFAVEYGKTYFQFAGRPSFISITTNTDRFFKQRKNKETAIAL